jgi:putative salt-induced outer membrane protein YdiY
MNKTNIALALVLLAGVIAPHAADTIKAQTNKWEASAAAGITLTRGNSDTFLGNLTLNAARKAPRDEVLLGASATYGTTEKETQVTFPSGVTLKRDESETTTANAAAFGQYNHLFTEQFYGGVRLNLLHDAIADVKYRVTLSPLAGYYLIKNPRTRLAVEAGPSFIAEKVGNDSDQYVALRVAERLEHKLSDKAKVWQSIEVLPQIDDFQNYLVNAEIGVEAGLSEKLSLRAVLQDTYDNVPAEGRKKNDLKLITALVYRF